MDRRLSAPFGTEALAFWSLLSRSLFQTCCSAPFFLGGGPALGPGEALQAPGFGHSMAPVGFTLALLHMPALAFGKPCGVRIGVALDASPLGRCVA